MFQDLENRNLVRQITSTEVEEIIRAAQKSPSGDNCQPFTFHWNGHTLSIRLVKERAEHFIDVMKLGTIVGLGTIVESIAVTARSLGYGIAPIANMPDFELRDNQLLVEIEFIEDLNPVTKRDLNLYKAIFKRATDRREYVANEHASMPWLLAKAEVNHFQAKPCSELIKLLTDGDEIIWNHKSAQQDLMKWIRITNKELEARDGMPWQTLGINAMEKMILLLNRSWWIQKLSNLTGGLFFVKAVTRRVTKSADRLVLFTAKDKTPEAVMNAGRKAMRVWLQLVSEGAAAQPMSVVPFFSFAHECEDKDARSLKNKFLQHSMSDLKRLFNVETGHPVWMLRVGWPPEKSVPRSPRLKLESCATIKK